jgi:tryptophanyl-tRNA synthetase
MQPTADSLHLGNYLGALRQWVSLQADHDVFYFVADMHSITLEHDPALLRQRTRVTAAQFLAAGVDLDRATLFVQSHVVQHAQLQWVLGCNTGYGEAQRMTQFKDKVAQAGGDRATVGLLTYPILQAADILLYRADRVPVGEDQLQHLELSRVIARRWNAEFAPDDDYFPEPQPVLTPTRRIMGLDGQSKMSKSMGNTIGLLESPEEIWAKLRPAVTDPKRIKRTDPGTPEVCNIYHLHKAFSPPATVEHVAVQCSTAGWGCIDCKKVLAESMESELVPIRARAAALRADPARVDAALAAGAERCRTLARETMCGVRERMGFD